VRNLTPHATPLLIINTSGLELNEAGPWSKVNRGEAELVLQHCKKLLEAGVKPDDIGIISPYKAQAISGNFRYLINLMMMMMIISFEFNTIQYNTIQFISA
jgi:hypothetical protein